MVKKNHFEVYTMIMLFYQLLCLKRGYLSFRHSIPENHDLRSIGASTESAEAFGILTSTLRYSIADRIEYVMDLNWETVPVDGLISNEYSTSISSVIGSGKAMDEIKAGAPRESISKSITAERKQFLGPVKLIEPINEDYGYTISNLNSGLGSDQAPAVDEAAGTPLKLPAGLVSYQ